MCVRGDRLSSRDVVEMTTYAACGCLIGAVIGHLVFRLGMVIDHDASATFMPPAGPMPGATVSLGR
jgi:hypothetical protein